MALVNIYGTTDLSIAISGVLQGTGALVGNIGTLTFATTGTLIQSPGATFRKKFADAYAARQTLLNKISERLKVLADTAQSTANTALTNAATAQAAATAAAGDATAALSALTDIANDNLLTPGEKPVVIRDRDALVAEQAGIDAQATAYAITTEKTTYDSAVSALTTYLATLTTPVLWSTLSGNTTIVGTTFRTKFLDVYNARQALLNKIYANAKSLADAAATAASNAQTAANTANAALADIANDNLLTPGEKPLVIADYADILAEQSGIDTQATSYGITTEKTTYDTAVTALTTYLGTLTSAVAWNNLTGNTTIVGTTFRTKFSDVYAARQALLNKIVDVVTNAKTAGNGTNILWDEYSRFAYPTLPTLGGVSSCTVTRDTSQSYFGTASLKAQVTATDPQFQFGATYNIPITPGRKYIISFYGRFASVPTSGQLPQGGLFATSTFAFAGFNLVGGGTVTATTWQRYFMVVDTASFAATDTLARLRLDPPDNMIGAAMWVDGIMVEPMIGSSTTPSPYAAGQAGQLAAAAQTAADAAATQAATANADLANIANDNLLTPGEKGTVIADYADILAEQSGIDGQATNYGITTTKTTYDTAVSALTTYLGTLTTPVTWNNLTGNTTITGTTFRTKFSDVYAARQALLNAILAGAQSGMTGSGNLLVNSDFDPDLSAWYYSGGSVGGAADMTRDLAGTVWQIVGTHNLGLHHPGTPTAGNYTDARTDPTKFPTVISGRSYIFSVYAASLRSTAGAYIGWYDSAGTNLGYSQTPVTVAGAGGSSWANHTRLYIKATAPVNAVRADIFLRQFYQGGLTDCYAWFTRPMLEEVSDSQLLPSPWTTGNLGNYATIQATLTVLSDIASDNVLTPVEKTTVINAYNVIIAAQTSLDASATALTITTEKTTYDSAVSALTSYLGGLTTPVAWNNVSGNTTIVGTTFRSKFYDVYVAEAALRDKVAGRNLDVAQSTELVMNNSFENGSTGWTLDSGWAVSTQSFALRGTTVAGKTGNSTVTRLTNNARIYAPAGSRCIATASLRAGSGCNGNTYMGVLWYNDAGSLIGESGALASGNAALIGVWKQARCVSIVPAGASYGRVHVTTDTAHTTGVLYVDCVDVEMAVQTQADLLPIGVGSVGSRWDGLTISYTTPGGSTTPDIITVNVSAGTLRAGTLSVAYNSSSATASQSRSTTVSYYLYYLDAQYSGGSRTLNMTTDPNALANANEVVWIGSVDVVFAASGGGTGSGGIGGGCVDIASFVDYNRTAGDSHSGQSVLVSDQALEPRVSSRMITNNRIVVQPCHRIVTTSGAALVASDTTPMNLPDGRVVTFPEMLGEQACVMDADGVRWETVVECEDVGMRPVAYISVDDWCYFAGERPGVMIASHNIRADKP